MGDASYEAAMQIVSELKALDGPNVNPLCQTRAYTHGRRTDRSLLLLHGFTNCPQQFDALGRRFHDDGWNVLIPRYPRHGYTNRLSTSISKLRSDLLVAVAVRSAAAASGLGGHLTVAGLSLGGVLAGHLAQSDAGVDRAVLIAPMFGVQRIPGPGLAALARLAYALPNFFVWWDPRSKDTRGPAHAYPRVASHAFAAVARTASGVLRDAGSAPPKARELAVITNAAETGLDNRFTYRLVQAWRSRGASVSTYEFPASDRLPHDLIDPANEDQNTGLVYPVVIKTIVGG